MVFLVICIFWFFFEALNGAFDVQFFRASFLHLTKDTDIACRDIYIVAQKKKKVKTLLNDAFKYPVIQLVCTTI